MYQRRSKVNPLYNQLIVGGFRENKRYAIDCSLSPGKISEPELWMGFGTIV